MTELVKLPVPVPSVVRLLEMVGFWLVLQQTPRAVTAEPPSPVIFPPVMTDVDVIDVNVAVVNTGKAAAVVVADTWFP